jgi:osmotically-inducible protein OsmY
MSDSEPSRHLVAKIREALAEDPRTHVLDVQVMVSSGKVFLMGSVACDERRSAVIEVTRELLPEGFQVVNELWIETLSEPTEPERLG